MLLRQNHALLLEYSAHWCASASDDCDGLEWLTERSLILFHLDSKTLEWISQIEPLGWGACSEWAFHNVRARVYGRKADVRIQSEGNTYLMGSLQWLFYASFVKRFPVWVMMSHGLQLPLWHFSSYSFTFIKRILTSSFDSTKMRQIALSLCSKM